MSTMIIEVYDAFKSAGASEEMATAAAKAIADYDNRFNKVEADSGTITSRTTLRKPLITNIRST